MAVSDVNDGEGSKFGIGRWIEHLKDAVPCLAFFLHEFLLLMLTLYLGKCYLVVNSGDTSMLLYGCLAFGVGILVVLLPISGLCSEHLSEIWFGEPRYCPGGKVLSRVMTFIFHAGFLIAMIVLFALLFSTTASLDHVSSTMWIRPSCSDGKLLEVHELLTYRMKGGRTSLATRLLDNQVEPTDFAVFPAGGDAGPSSLRISKIDRKEPGVTSWYYESGQRTQLNFEFDTFTNPGNSSLQFWLVYLARLRGSSARCSDGGAVCSDELDSALSRVTGHWTTTEVGAASDLVIGSCASGLKTDFVDKTCASSSNATSATDAYVDMVTPGEWTVVARVPKDSSVGSQKCPLAWAQPERNIFWIVGSGALLAAGTICFLAFSIADSGGANEGGPILCAAALSCCCVIIAVVLFGLALFSDGYFGEEAN
eukprot:TRINITY_DN5282_c0_g1_i1.p1 TRINITY_DN5282_c0_g1~~TRINITY_DN5282_c0_g1_i1.p1  ORF type:complete len:446 (+),score=28.21 TRINITY_DN5282_c0_g1_i1:69-1340(+)